MIFALLIISFILSGCFNIFKFDPKIKHDVGIPSITISGKNTFGCKIDKVAWRAENEYSSYKTKRILLQNQQLRTIEKMILQ